jgi:hypothetical protein
MRNRLLIALLIGGLWQLLPAQKKPEPEPAPPQTWPTSRVLQSTCESVWPVALQLLIAEGWTVKTSDRAGGLLTLEWTRGEIVGRYRKINPLVGQHTIEKSTGFWTQYTGFRIVSAQAISAPQGAGCSYGITVVYHGREVRSGQGERWWILRSNGWLEDKLLGQIEAKLSKQ